MPSQNAVFTSWKEIASYVGKGVRTVQRWEAQFGLPVRRLDGKGKRICATRDDLDRWLSSQWSLRQPEHPVVANDLAELRKAVAELQRENAALRRALEQRGPGNGWRADGRPAGTSRHTSEKEHIVSEDESASL